jgi:hypothetical protein
MKVLMSTFMMLGVKASLKGVRVCKSPLRYEYIISKYLMWWPIYKRILGNIFFPSKNIFGGPPRGVNSEKVEFQRIGTKCGPIFAISGQRQNIPIFLHIFSGLGDRIHLNPFLFSQASSDTSLDYSQHIIPRTLKFHFF